MNKIKIVILTILCSVFVISLSSCVTKESSSKSISSTSESSSSSTSESVTSSSSSESTSSTSESSSAPESSSKIEEIKYTLSFNPQGGGDVESKEYTEGTDIEEVEAPTKSGWLFQGWFLDRSFNEAMPEVMPDSNLVVYAKWTSEERAVTSFSNSSVMPVATVKGEVLEMPTDPIKDGYEFDGWYTDSLLTVLYDKDQALNSDQTLYAKWNQTDDKLYVVVEAKQVQDKLSTEFFYDKDSSFDLSEDYYGTNNSFQLYTDSDMTVLYSDETLVNNQVLYADIETKGLEYEGNTVVNYVPELINPAKTIYIPYKHNDVSITEIGNEAFYNIDSIKEVKMTDEITVIGNKAFAYSSYLVEAILPKNLVSLGEHAFDSTIRLENIGSLGMLTNVSAYTFMGDISLTDFVVSPSVESISEYAFSNDKLLTEFSFLNVKSISKYAFSNTSLESVSISSNLTVLEEGAFMNVDANFTVSDSSETFKLENGFLTSFDYKTLYLVTDEIAEFNVSDYDEIKQDALEGATLLKVVVSDPEATINVLSGVKSVNYLVVKDLDTPIASYFGGKDAVSNGLFSKFIPNNISTVEVETKTSDIPSYAFYGMNSLTEVKGISLVTIGDYAFAGTDIKDLVLDKDLTEFNPNVVSFVEVNSISADDNSVYKVGTDGALVTVDETELVYVPSSLTSYTIPSTIKLVLKNAFNYSYVESIVVPSTVDSLEFGAFMNMRVISSYTAPFIGDNSTDDTMYSPFGGSISESGEITGQKVPSTIHTVTITGDIIAVTANAFLLCDGLLEINLPDSVKSIGDYGMALTGITSLTLPKSCVSIGANAFSMNFNLITVETNAKLRSIGSEAFSRNPFIEEIVFAEGLETIPANMFDCYSENSVYGDDSSSLLYLSKINKIVLPSTLKTIGDSAFAYAGLWDDDLEASFSISIRDVENSKLESIGDNAFKNSAISYFVLPSTLVSIGDSAFENATNLYEVEVGFNGECSLESIGNSCFKDTDLRKLTINKVDDGSDLEITVLEDAFLNCDKLVVYVPSNLIEKINLIEVFMDIKVEAIK